jgi:dienelactone hydrolase
MGLMSVILLLAHILAGPSPLWGGLESGRYRVGFEQIEAWDYSRPFRSDSSNRARPISMFIWYPARVSDEGAVVEFGRYAGGPEGRERLARRLDAYGLSLTNDELDTLLSSPSAAFTDAPREKGPFPLILFSAGLTGPSYLNTVLCEYLASHGYVSVAIPSLPPREDRDADFDLHSVDAQMRDMEFVIQQMHDYPEVTLDRIGLVAWSLGGVSQALLQMKNSDVAALVSLDAATGYAYGRELLESSLFYEPERATAAFFHATDSRESGPVPKSFRYYDAVAKGDSYLLMLAGAAHAEFNSLATVVSGSVAPGRVSPDAVRRYRLLCLYVRQFLDASLKDDVSAREFLDVAPTRHGFDGLVLSRKR